MWSENRIFIARHTRTPKIQAKSFCRFDQFYIRLQCDFPFFILYIHTQIPTITLFLDSLCPPPVPPLSLSHVGHSTTVYSTWALCFLYLCLLICWLSAHFLSYLTMKTCFVFIHFTQAHSQSITTTYTCILDWSSLPLLLLACSNDHSVLSMVRFVWIISFFLFQPIAAREKNFSFLMQMFLLHANRLRTNFYTLRKGKTESEIESKGKKKTVRIRKKQKENLD